MRLVCRLELEFCTSLRRLPHSLTRLGSLAELDITWCDQLEGLPAGLGSLAGLTRLCLAGCERLHGLPDSATALTGAPEFWTLNPKPCCPSVGQALHQGVSALAQLRLGKRVDALPDIVTALTGAAAALSPCRTLWQAAACRAAPSRLV